MAARPGFGAHVGFLPDRDVGVIVLSNLENQGFPDAVAQWFYDRLLGNPEVDNLGADARDLTGQEEQAKANIDPTVRAPTPALDPYTGVYTSRLLGDATVRTSGPKSKWFWKPPRRFCASNQRVAISSTRAWRRSAISRPWSR